MTKSPSIVIKTLLILAVAGSMAAFTAPPADAQTAKKLKCNGCVKTKHLKNGGVKGKDLKDSTVTGSKIAPNAIDGSKIADGAVGSSEVAGESLTATDMSDEAGANFLDSTVVESVTTTEEIVETLTLVAPAPGVVIVSASGWYFFNTGQAQGTCSITPGSTVDNNARIVGEGTNVSPDDIESYSGTRGFEVAAGSNDFNLVCRSSSAANSVNVIVETMTAIFVPSRY